MKNEPEPEVSAAETTRNGTTVLHSTVYYSTVHSIALSVCFRDSNCRLSSREYENTRADATDAQRGRCRREDTRRDQLSSAEEARRVEENYADERWAA